MKQQKKKIIKTDIMRGKLGNSPRIKILEFLTNNREESWGLKEILKFARVKYRTAVKELKDLIDKDLVYIEKTLGKSHLYKINETNSFIQNLIFSIERRKE